MPTIQVPLAYQPTARQSVFHACDADEVLYGGAAGGAKSHGLLLEAFVHCVENTGATAALVRRTFPELNGPDGLIDMSRRLFPSEVCTYSEQARRYRFVNDSSLHFLHFQYEADVQKAKGMQFTFLGIDELTEFTEYMILFLYGRVRSSRSIRTRIRCTSNSTGVGHAFTKARYVQPVLDGRVCADEVWQPEPTETNAHPATRAYIPATLDDNPHIDPGYESKLDDLPDVERLALRHGIWDLPSGPEAVFKAGVLLAMRRGATGWQEPQPGRRYLHLWDLARKRDWVVGGTLDVTELPAQLVAFTRYRREPWPSITADMARRHAYYKTALGATSTTCYDSTGVGDVVGGYLEIPLDECEGYTFTARSKYEAIESLRFVAEREALKAPVAGHDPRWGHEDRAEHRIERLWEEMALYAWDDASLVQDCVIMLALGAQSLRARIEYLLEPLRETMRRATAREEEAHAERGLLDEEPYGALFAGVQGEAYRCPVE